MANGWTAFLNGAAIVIAVQLNLAILNGLTARFSQNNETMEEMIQSRVGGA